MANKTWKIGKMQVEYRHSSKLLKTLVILLIAFSMTALGALWWVKTDIERQTEKLRSDAAAVALDNLDLKEKIDKMDTIQGQLEIAREELGLVPEDALLIKPQS